MQNTSTTQDQYKPVNLLVTNYKKGIIKKPIKLNLAHQYGNEYQNEALTAIHIFESLPFVRNIPVNKYWFENDIFSFS